MRDVLVDDFFLLLLVFLLLVFFLDLRPFGQPASIRLYDCFETVDFDFGRLVPLRLRRLIFSTRELRFFAMALSDRFSSTPYDLEELRCVLKSLPKSPSRVSY